MSYQLIDPAEPAAWNGAGGSRGVKKPGTPNSIAWEALNSLTLSRSEASAGIAGAVTPELTISQNSRRRATRCSAGLPAISAALMAPMEMPATQVGSR